MTEIDFDAAREQYFANTDYDLAQSVDKCRAFIDACRKLMVAPKSAERDDEKAEFEPEHLRRQEQQAMRWLDRNGATSGVNQRTRILRTGDARW